MTAILLFLSILFNHAISRDVTTDVNTTSGVVKGQIITSWLNTPLNVTLLQFFGIPFAKPPIGRLRFAKPKPLSRPLKVSPTNII